MPDLAATGEDALKAARTYGSLTWGPPATDCASYLSTIISLVRAILLEEAQQRIDVHVIVQLCSGMTAFLDPYQAIRQVVHAVGLCAETMGWTRPGWIAALVEESLDSTSGSIPMEAPETYPSLAPSSAPTTPGSTTLSFQGVPAPRPLASVLPTVSQPTRDRLTWLAVETRQSIDGTVGTLIDLYLLHREGTNTMGIFRRTLALADQLKVAELHVNDIRGYLAIRARLARHHCDYQDVPYALQLLDRLSALSPSWTWKQVEHVLDIMAVVLQEEIKPDEVATFLVRHRQLARLGFTEATMATLLKALKRSGVNGRKQDRIVPHMVTLATQQVQIEDLEESRQQKATHLQTLEAQIQEAEARLQPLQQQVTQMTQQLRRLQEDFQHQTEHLATLEGIKAFLLGRLSTNDPLWDKLECLIHMKRRGELSSEQTQQIITTHLMTKFTEFLAQVVADDLQAP